MAIGLGDTLLIVADRAGLSLQKLLGASHAAIDRVLAAGCAWCSRFRLPRQPTLLNPSLFLVFSPPALQS